MLTLLAGKDPFDDWSPAARLIGCIALVAIAVIAIMVSGDDDE